MDKQRNINVTRSSLPDFEEYIEEIRELWDSRWLTNMGSLHEKLTQQLKLYLGVENVSLFTNGHLALETAIQGLNLTGEVITTPFTFASTTHAIVRNGLKPVFCDINEEDYTIDAGKIEGLITDKTSAIVPVHVYGNICDVANIERIAKKYNLKIIYDAAHAFGEEFNNTGIGCFGDISMFSFHATKVYNTIEGGGLTYSDDSYTEIFNNLKNFGIAGTDSVKYISGNAKMNEFCAAMGLCNLRKVNAEINKRKAVYETYLKYLNGIDGINLIKYRDGLKPNYAYFPVMFERDKLGVGRDDIYKALSENNINARKYFYPLINEFDCYRENYDVRETPRAKKAAYSVLTLPMYADLEHEDIKRICTIILGACRI